MALDTLPQPIAGVSPPELRETTVMTVWPSMAGTGIGRWLGRLYQIRWGWGVFTVGHLIALLAIPLSLIIFFHKFIVAVLQAIPGIGRLARAIPGVAKRYTLTNRRVVIQAGLRPDDESWVDLDHFDSIEVEVLPGQEWYPAGDLVFKNGPIVTFRLPGVLRPQTFRRTCLKARQGYVGVKAAQG